jgi:hypothetical protein
MVLHPDKFDWDLADRINNNYEFIYGQSVNADDVANILRMDMNKDAANYDIFAAN